MNASTQELKIMTHCKPFRAWRYNPEKSDFSKVLAPPYDVISPEEQDKLYEASPYNCIRLILNKKEATDNDSENVYTRARDFFQEWQKENILIRDEKPCFYLYKQTFKDPIHGETKERSALLVRTKVEPFEERVVIPHEKTLKGPKEDRMKLLQTTETNFSAVFGLYEDQSLVIGNLLSEASKQKPIFNVADDKGITHALWVIEDDAVLEKIHTELQTKKLYIADGHHRYETALAYSQKKNEENPNPSGEPQPYDFTLMALVSFSDPGFLLLPTHRILKNLKGLSEEDALKRLEEVFDVEPSTDEALKALTEEPEGDSLQIGLILKEKGAFLLTLRDKEKAKEKMPPGKSDAWYELNVNLLGHLIFSSLWNIQESDYETLLKFEHQADKAVNSVRQGGFEAVFLLKAPKVEMLEKMGAHGERMPQKSTFFYPKVASGLLFHNHSE